MNEKQDINILDIIKAYQKKDFEYLRTIGKLTCNDKILYVNDDINVFYELNEEDLNATVDEEGFELSDASNKKPHTINDIYYIEFNKNYIYFEFTGRSLFLKIQYNTFTGKQIEIDEKEVSYFYIDDQEYKFYLDNNIVCNLLESV